MNRFGIGQPVRRVEDLRFITGQGRYVADIDLTRPDREGVAGSQLPPQFMPEDMGGPKGYRAIRLVLAAEVVKHVGDRVAFVVAEIAAQGWMPWSMLGFGSWAARRSPVSDAIADEFCSKRVFQVMPLSGQLRCTAE